MEFYHWDFILWICSDLTGDRPRELPKIKELKDAVDVTERKGDPSWDFDVSGVIYKCVFLMFLVMFLIFLH